MKKIPCFILARKNSKGIKDKNIINLGDKKLIQHTIDFVKKCKLINTVVISTDDKRIAKISNNNKCYTIYPRPKLLSNDKATSESALKHALMLYEKKFGKTEIVSYVQITEPFRPTGILDKCIKVLKKDKSIDSCFAAFEQKKNFWVSNKNGYLKRITPLKERYKPRQIKESILREDTGIALATRSKFVRKSERIGSKVKCIKYQDPKYNIDINHQVDLNLAKKII